MESRMMKVLMIDDNQDNLTILNTLILEAFPNTRVLSALNGQKGLALAASEEPDIILLDIIMPGMDGYEVCRRLKGDEKLCDIPVVFVTAIRSNKESRIRALECGAEAFLTKPIDDIELTAQIRAMLKIRAANIQKRDEKQILSALVEDKTRELLAANAELKQSEERFQLLFEKAPLGYQSLDFDGRFIEVNQQWLDTLGYTREEVIGKWFGDFLCPEYVEGFRKRFPIFKAQGFIHSEFEMLAKNGNRLFIAFDGRIGYDVGGNFVQTHCILKDITDQRKAEAALQESERTNRLLLDHLQVGIVVHNADSSILFSNPLANELLGLSSNQMKNKPVSDKEWCFYDAHGEPLSVESYPFSLVNKDKKLINYEMGISQEGVKDIKWFLVNGFVIPDKTGDFDKILISFIDITEKKRAIEDVQYLAYHDYLTDTYNRRFFENEYDSKNTGEYFPLVIVTGDLNGLKLINDSFGHYSGDYAIKQFAVEIQKRIPEKAILARVSGDEFSIILTRSSEEEARLLTGELQSNIRFSIKDNKGNDVGAELTATFGYSCQSFPGQGLDDLSKEAETFMFRRKFLENTSKRSNVIEAIMSTLFEKSEREQQHSLRVSSVATAIATAMGLDDTTVAKVRVAGSLHDIGKIGIDESILNKAEQLSDQEWELIKQHPIRSARILASVDEYLDIVPIVKAHHERIDGSGYPAGLTDKQIPIEAKIIAVADSFDAMTVSRPYRDAISKESAAEELKRCAGSQFDQEVVDAFVRTVLPGADPFVTKPKEIMDASDA